MTTTALKLESIDLPAINWKMAAVIGFCVSLALLAFYVWQINTLTKGYYLMNSYENKISSLSQENKNLQVSFAESSFWGQTNEKMQEMNFKKVDTSMVQYIQIPELSMAINKK